MTHKEALEIAVAAMPDKDPKDLSACINSDGTVTTYTRRLRQDCPPNWLFVAKRRFAPSQACLCMNWGYNLKQTILTGSDMSGCLYAATRTLYVMRMPYNLGMMLIGWLHRPCPTNLRTYFYRPVFQSFKLKIT